MAKVQKAAKKHKVRVDIPFESLEAYMMVKEYLDTIGIKLDAFASYAVNQEWNRLVKERDRYLKEVAERDADSEKALAEKALAEKALAEKAAE